MPQIPSNSPAPNSQQLQELLRQAAQQLGTDPSVIQSSAQSGNVNGLLKNLRPQDAQNLQKVLADKEATAKMLSQQLRDLQQSGLVSREVIPENPPKTIYSLTPFGRSIIPVLEAMCNWGTGYLDGLDVQTPCCPSTKK